MGWGKLENSYIPGIRTDVVEALRQINIPNLRWPGGCFADDYHWRDGIGPKRNRPSRVNIHWGNVVENNHFGTHEFLDLCIQLDCEPYICGNLGSGTVQEMRDWLEYLTFDGNSTLAIERRTNGQDEPWKINYWGVGNENWGCGGHMRAEYYADEYRRFATYCRQFNKDKLYRIASGTYDKNYHWTDKLMRETASHMEGLSLHYYSMITLEEKQSATQINETDWFSLLKKALFINPIISQHSAIMDRYDPDKHIGLIIDEWGAWHTSEPGTNPAFLYQQNTLRDAILAAATLHIFHNHCDRIHMANIAQLVNVLQAMILTEGESMILTPTYHVFEMFKGHQNTTRLPIYVECEDYIFENDNFPSISASASRNKAGEILISICNLNPNQPIDLLCNLKGTKHTKVSGRLLTSDTMNAFNTFESTETVHPVPFDEVRIEANDLKIELPSKSVVTLTIS